MDNEEFYLREKNLLDMEIDSVKIWRYDRFSVHRYMTEIDSKDKMVTNLVRGDDKIDFAGLLKLFLKYRVGPVKKSDILMFNHSRKVMKNGEYICKFTEQISDYYDSTVTYETTFEDKHMEPAHTKNLRYIDRIVLISYMYELINRKIFSKKYKRIHTEIFDAVNNAFGDLFEEKAISYVSKSLVKNLYLIKCRRFLFKKLLEKISPKIILEVVSYSWNNMIINELAAKMNIPTVELQHSLINSNLVQYMWGERRDIEQFPQYFFSYGDFWSEGLKMPIPSEKIISVGFPYFEREIEELQTREPNENLKCDILFISQFLAGSSVYELTKEYCRNNPDKKIIYKLHPDEYGVWETRYPELKNLSNVKVITDKKISLYECFLNTKAVVGVFSGALYEALAFDLPVYLYKAKYMEYMQGLIDANGAIVVENAEQLADCINNTKKSEVKDLEIWKTNAFENMIKAIDGIMGEKN